MPDRTPNELLVLAAIGSYSAGCSQYYVIKETDTSPGVIVPLLRRLESQGLVEIHKVGPRGQIRIWLTALGKEQLEGDWLQQLDFWLWKIDAVLKLIKAKEWLDLPQAVSFAHQAIEYRRAALSRYRDREGKIAKPPLQRDVYKSYQELHFFHQLHAELATLKELEAALAAEL